MGIGFTFNRERIQSRHELVAPARRIATRATAGLTIANIRFGEKGGRGKQARKWCFKTWPINAEASTCRIPYWCRSLQCRQKKIYSLKIVNKIETATPQTELQDDARKSDVQ